MHDEVSDSDQCRPSVANGDTRPQRVREAIRLLENSAIGSDAAVEALADVAEIVNRLAALSVTVTELTETHLHGRVIFSSASPEGSRWVDAGTIHMTMRQLLDRLADSNRTTLEAASLSVDHPQLTPPDRDLVVEAWVHRDEGRVRHLIATIADGEHVTARAEAVYARR